MLKLKSFIVILAILLSITGCTSPHNNDNGELQLAAESPETLTRYATSYDLAYTMNDENNGHLLLWEHAVKDMDFPTPKHLHKTQSSRRLHANRRYFEKKLASGELFLYHIVKDLKQRNMPLELAVIPIIESDFNPKAVSPNGARGIWQFMPGTARYFSLKSNHEYDMRLDIIASTDAALNYFEQLYKMFGDWNLAIAAYNVGPGTIQKAINKNKKARRKTDLWHLSIPHSGVEYVERLYAFTDFIRQSDKYNITFPVIRYQPVFKKVELKNRSLKEVAIQTGTSLEILKKLNPGFVSSTGRTSMVDYVLVPVKEFNPDLDG